MDGCILTSSHSKRVLTSAAVQQTDIDRRKKIREIIVKYSIRRFPVCRVHHLGPKSATAELTEKAGMQAFSQISTWTRCVGRISGENGLTAAFECRRRAMHDGIGRRAVSISGADNHGRGDVRIRNCFELAAYSNWIMDCACRNYVILKTNVLSNAAFQLILSLGSTAAHAGNILASDFWTASSSLLSVFEYKLKARANSSVIVPRDWFILFPCTSNVFSFSANICKLVNFSVLRFMLYAKVAIMSLKIFLLCSDFYVIHLFINRCRPTLLL